MSLNPILNKSPNKDKYLRIPIWRNEYRALRKAGISQIGMHLLNPTYHVSRAEHLYHYQVMPLTNTLQYRVIEGQNDRNGKIEVGNIWQCPQHLPYEFTSKHTGQALWWSFDPKTFPESLQKERIIPACATHERLATLLTWIYEDHSHSIKYSPQHTIQMVQLLADYLQKSCIHTLHTQQSAHINTLLQPLWEAIYQHPEIPWTLDDLAKRCNLSKFQLTRIVKKEYQCTPIAMLTQIRLTQAEELIIQNELPLQKIAELLGFSTGFALSKAFKKHHGLSPKKFREQYIISINK